jgi:YVTN family beta-propeller protein
MRLSFLAAILAASLGVAQDKADPTHTAGPTATGFLLPNGWHLTPVGKHVVTTDLPLNVIPLKDGRHVLVATSGYNTHELSLVDIGSAEPKIVSHTSVRQSWYGLAIDKAESRLWWSGGGYEKLHTFDLKDGQLTRNGPPEPEPKKERGGRKNAAKETPKKDDDAKDEETPKKEPVPKKEPSPKRFPSGLCLDESRGILCSLSINTGELSVINLKDGATKTVSIGGRPYDVVVGPNQLFVSDWAGRQVLVVDLAELRVVRKIPVGEHPNQMALHKDGRLFVACASTNAVSVIDTKRGYVVETISTALFPKAPEGSTPDALVLSPDDETLYVTNADNNCVAVIDVEAPRKSAIKGFIPTGWYPTAVAMTPDGKNLLVGVGKGLQSKANPFSKKEDQEQKDHEDGVRRLPFPYIGTTVHGALSVVPVPDEKQLKEYTAQVYRNCPYSDEQLTAAPHPVKTAIPTKVGDASPIKYVIYIIKENRTYDQVFGDLPQGNGDPKLCMFPRKVSPNHHKLAEEFVLLDNLYCNGQVSRDGHPWSTMAYNTDYISRDWHLTYSRRKGVDDDDEGHLQNAPSGYLWDACARAGLSYRSYGEYGKRVSDGAGASKMEGRVPGLVGHFAPTYGLQKRAGEKVRDTDNAETFNAEYDDFAKMGTMPRFIVMSLGEDHTTGTTIDTFTPRACVASNDVALGQIVEHVSNGPLWKETAIFVIEDDAQNGPDHVDAHRTVGLVVSPFTKRKHVDHTQYSTVSMIRTIELILGLEPLSQYDAAARPMFNSFSEKAHATAYKHEPARIDVNEKNTRLAYGADRSGKMDFTEYDRIDDFELNEILWHAVMGTDAAEPPAVRRAIAFRSLTGSKGK